MEVLDSVSAWEAARAGHTPPLVARPLAELSDADEWERELVGLLREAGNPYCDWFFDGPARATAAVARAFGVPSSELAAGGVTVLTRRGRLVGVFVAHGGRDLALRRKADALTALAEAHGERAALVRRLERARDLFLPVDPDVLYVSRIAVTKGLRGQGFGRTVLACCLASGRAAGFRRFGLDVAADNERAIRLYRSFGFTVAATRTAAGMRYVRMALEGQDAASVVRYLRSRAPASLAPFAPAERVAA